MLREDDLMGMIASETVDGDSSFGCHDYGHVDTNPQPVYEDRSLTPSEEALPPIRYNLELIRHPDGRLEWVE